MTGSPQCKRHVGQPPRDFWRDTPCGHPRDPIGYDWGDGRFSCHCGQLLDPAEGRTVEGAPGPVVYCDSCGCHVALVAQGQERQPNEGTDHGR